MSTFIQVNIYNQTLDVLKMRGLDLQMILKTIGCPDTYIAEVPILPHHQSRKKSLTPSADIDSASSHINSTTRSIKPFKSISAEIGSIQPLNLNAALSARPLLSSATIPNRKRTASGLNGLFDDWDPTANLDSSVASSSQIPLEEKQSDTTIDMELGLKVPKEEPREEEDLNPVEESTEPELTTERERSMIDDLFRQHRVPVGLKREDDSQNGNMNYVITCNHPGCGLQYNWRIKYGKLRLLDHALTHSARKIPCKLCGFECANVSRMRSHYVKAHPNERMEGYGMKALVSGNDGDSNQQVDEEELKKLWNICYAESIHLVGQAVGFGEGDKFKRLTKSRKMEREARNMMGY